MKRYLAVIAIGSAISSSGVLAASSQIVVPSVTDVTYYGAGFYDSFTGRGPTVQLGEPIIFSDGIASNIRSISFGFETSFVPLTPGPIEQRFFFQQGFINTNLGSVTIDEALNYSATYELSVEAPSASQADFPLPTFISVSSYLNSFKFSFSGRLSNSLGNSASPESVIDFISSDAAPGIYVSETFLFFDSNIQDRDVNGVAYLISPIPEPQTYALLLVGLFTLGFIVRTKKVNVRSSRLK